VVSGTRPIDATTACVVDAPPSGTDPIRPVPQSRQMSIARALIRISGDIRQYLIRESITAIQAFHDATALPVLGQSTSVSPAPALRLASGC
jgi:hypothetical protein